MPLLPRHFSRLAFAALLAAMAVSPSRAADLFYIGRWKIESATVAPWWNNPAEKPDAAESRQLVGKVVTITARAIQGARQVACSNPRYEVKVYPADMLFEGMFGEMHERDKSVDPAKIAASVGFRGTEWKTLETGCAIEVSYHFIDPATATFGLNNYIYTLKKQP